jgi:glyoxylase-like metal-dependent hydrolase (beta-lactamase superfamily II)
VKLPGAREIDPFELAIRLEAGDRIRILDVRAPQRLAAGRVDPVPADRFHNIPGSEFVRMADPAASIGLDPADPVVVVCGHGNDSRVIAALLDGRGHEAWSLRGGVTGWMRMVIPRELASPAGFSRLVQFDRIGKGALGYLLVAGDEALAIDPPRDWAPWPEAASASGARIVAVADTHVHADFISGASDLARDQGVPYYLHPADNVWPYDDTPGRLEFEPLSDETELSIGGRAVVARHTPGHTEGSTTFIAGDPQDAGVAFTGDFLFVDSIGRPDLAGRMESWTGDLWRSLVRARDEWGPHVRLLPAHYSGEGERNADRTVDRAFGEAREANATLRIETEDQFRAWVESHVSSPPEAYPHIKAINVGLAEVTPQQADVLEAGKHECAVG